MFQTPRSVAIALIMLTATLAAACGSGSRANPEPTGPAATATAGIDATATVSPHLALAASAQQFDRAAAYGIRFKITADGVVGEDQGDAVYRAHTVLYSRIETVGGQPADTEPVVSLFLPPDLYLQQGDGTWFVQSPWNLGVRRGELAPFDPNEPIVDYAKLAVALRDVDAKPDESGDGRTTRHYSGQIDISDLTALATTGATGVARADIWIDDLTLLPSKVEIEMARPARLVASINFDYGNAATIPPAPANARPFRDAQFPGAPCTSDELVGCLAAQTEIHGAATCAGTGRRVCLAPLGKISPALVDNLVRYYRDQYGLTVTVLAPASIPADLEDSKRQQVAADKLIDYMGSLFPDAYSDPQAVLIGLTPIDVYDGTDPHFRYVFGLKQTPSDPKAVVSSARMDPLFYSEPKDNALFATRTRKLMSKYIGLLYYRLHTSPDPASPMYAYIGGPNDVDVMTEPLPVPRQ